MLLQEILDKAQTDPQFAQELREKLDRACAAGPDSPEWEEYGQYFADDEEQLANFSAYTHDVRHGRAKPSLIDWTNNCTSPDRDQPPETYLCTYDCS
jgi:hypothetical protein